jgi:hypothetical protein
LANEIRIDWCPAERIAAVQWLIQNHWKPGHILARDAELLRWQHRYPGKAEQLSILLAEDEGAPVGMMGLIPVGFSVRGERLSGAWLALWLVVPEQVQQRLGLRLLKQVFAQGYDVVCCLGFREETTRGIYRALQFDTWDQIPRWVRVLSPQALEGLLADPSGSYPAAARQAWLATGQESAASPSSSRVRLLEWNEETAARWDRAWRQQFAPQLVGTWRDSGYLRWRYVDHPRFQYRLQFAEDRLTGSVSGLLVYRREPVCHGAATILRIVEFLATEVAGGALARAVSEAGREAEAAFADFFCTSPGSAAALEANGFVREENMPAPLPSRFQPLDFHRARLNGAFWIRPEVRQEGSGCLRSAGLYVTRADGDQDRPN